MTALALLLAVFASAAPPARIGVKDAGGCAPQQRAVIEATKPEARRRLAAAQALVGRGASADGPEREKLKALITLVDNGYAQDQMKGFADSLATLADNVGKIDYQCAAASDVNCDKVSGGLAGYVLRSDGADIVHLCPGFFRMDASARADHLVHEATHLLDARINDSADNGVPAYCMLFDCEMRCSSGPTVDGAPRPFFVADNWAHFVHCASGEKPQVEEIVGSPLKKK